MLPRIATLYGLSSIGCDFLGELVWLITVGLGISFL